METEKRHGEDRMEIQKKSVDGPETKRATDEDGNKTDDTDFAQSREDEDSPYSVGPNQKNGIHDTNATPLLNVAGSDESSAFMENKNTNRKTGADMKILTSYLKSLNEKRAPDCIPPIELDKYLSSFFMVVRKFDGAEYEPCSLRAMLASIERYLKLKCYPTSLTRDIQFAKTRAALKLKQQMLKQMGKGVKPQISSTSHVMEQRLAQLCQSQEFGPYTPVSVLFSICFIFVINLKMRKATEHKKLLWGDIMLGTEEETGREYLAFSPQMLHRTSNSQIRQSQHQVIWSKPEVPEQDPVALYKLYAEKRPIAANHRYSPFYLGVNVNQPAPAQSWYRPCALGMNKLNEMVRQIRDLTGVSSHVLPNESVTSGADREPKCDSANTSSVDSGEAEGSVCPTDHVEASSYQAMYKSGDGDTFHAAAQADSEMDSSDSLSYQSLSFNDDMAEDSTDQAEHFQGRLSGSTEENPYLDQSSFEYQDTISLPTAKQMLSGILQKMDIQDLVAFDKWLKTVKIKRDTVTGEIVCRDDVRNVSDSPSSRPGHDLSRESSPDKTRLESVLESTSISLNISLTPQALLGEGPVTVTAFATRPQSLAEPPEEVLAKSRGRVKSTPTKASNTAGITKSSHPVQILSSPGTGSEGSPAKLPRLSSGNRDVPLATLSQRANSLRHIITGQSATDLPVNSSRSELTSSSSYNHLQFPAHTSASLKVSGTSRPEPSIVKTVLQQTLRPDILSRTSAAYRHSLLSSLTNGHASQSPEPASGPVFPKPEPV